MDGFDGNINWKWCLRVAVGLAQGSSCLHIKGVIHRDIKSLNVYSIVSLHMFHLYSS